MDNVVYGPSKDNPPNRIEFLGINFSSFLISKEDVEKEEELFKFQSVKLKESGQQVQILNIDNDKLLVRLLTNNPNDFINERKS